MATRKSSKTSSRRSTKSAKKTAPKKTTMASNTDMMTTAKESESMKSSDQTNGDWRKRFFIPLVIVLVAALLYAGMQQLIVATVNGAPISRLTLLKEMESQIGNQVLDSLVTKQLILQMGRERNITVSEQEIDDEISKLEEQFASSGQTLSQILAAQNITMDRVREEIRVQKIIEKAVDDQIQVTDEDIDSFIEENKTYLGDDQDTTDESFRTDIRDQIKQQKMGTAMRTLIDELKTNADIKYFGSFKNESTPAPISAPSEPSDEVMMEETNQ